MDDASSYEEIRAGPDPAIFRIFHEVVAAGRCRHSIHLVALSVDKETGEILATNDVRIACKDRRAILCPSCAAVYKADAWFLVTAGLAGGSMGISESKRHVIRGAMLDSPLEGAQSRFGELRAWLASNGVIVVGGLLVGPLYGYLGQRWQLQRAWMSAVLVAGALCLEPIAQYAVGRVRSSSVSMGEFVVGVCVTMYFAVGRARFRRFSQSVR